MEGPFKPAGQARAAVYRSLWVAADVLQKAANGCLWIAAGLLQRADLQAASEARWRQFGKSIDEIDSGLDAFEQGLYSQLLGTSDRVLVIGAGTGREVLALRRLGYDVTGLEQVPQLVEIARQHMAQRLVDAPFEVGTIESTRLTGPFDAVIFSRGVYSFLRGSRARIAALCRIGTMLSSRGRILISYYENARGSSWGPRLARLGARLGRSDWRAERGDVFSRDHHAAHVLRYEHLFQAHDVAGECGAAGFVVTKEGSMYHALRFALAVRAPKTGDR
jgi:SAM-dependent methyltransferase